MIENMSDIQLGIIVTICGLVIVFAILAILVAVIGASGAINTGVANSNNKKEKPAVENKQAPAPKIVKPAVSDGIDDETVAVITAAVYSMYAGTGVTPRVSFIKSADKKRPAWASAGIAQNIKAF